MKNLGLGLFGGKGDKKANQNPYMQSSQVAGTIKGGGRSKVNYGLGDKKTNNDGRGFQQANNVTKGVAGGLTAMGNSMGGDYDPQLGMDKPSLGKDMMDFSVSSSLGLWGLLADIPKNLVNHYKNQRAYHHAKGQHQLLSSIQDQQKGLGADYTNMARYGYGKKNMMYGGENQGVDPVTMEKNEIVITQGQDGNYQPLMETGSNAPSHEEGGVKTVLPNNSLVFPEKYVNRVKQALATGDNDTINRLKNQMLMESTAASLQGLPFSNQIQ